MVHIFKEYLNLSFSTKSNFKNQFQKKEVVTLCNITIKKYLTNLDLVHFVVQQNILQIQISSFTSDNLTIERQ